MKNIYLGHGVNDLKFGMYTSDVEELFGEANEKETDENGENWHYDADEISFSFDDVDDANSFNRAWKRVTQQIIEKRSDQWWRVLARRIYWMIFRHPKFKVHYCI